MYRFHPGGVTAEIMKIVKGNYTEPWPTLSHVPEEAWATWFHEFTVSHNIVSCVYFA